MWPWRKKGLQSTKASIEKHTPLTKAVLGSDYAAMQRLLSEGADQNEFDGFRMTPLLWAIFRGDRDAVRMLLENGADPNVMPNPSDSPLWHAEDDFGMEEIDALLKTYGARR